MSKYIFHKILNSDNDEKKKATNEFISYSDIINNSPILMQRELTILSPNDFFSLFSSLLFASLFLISDTIPKLTI